MMPLALANVGEENLILRVGGSPELRKHLEASALPRAGPPPWSPRWAETSSSRSKESRVAISEEMARKIMI